MINRLSTYGISKAAVIHMTRAMALEWGRYGINVNAICPGYIDTDMNHHVWSTEQGQKFVKSLPRQRVGQPKDLDALLVTLCANESHFINGAIVEADDGFVGLNMRLELPDDKTFVHECVVPMRWGDMDAYGHINNTLYFRFMEIARIDWMRSVGHMGDGSGTGPVIVNAFCNFLVQLTFPGGPEGQALCDPAWPQQFRHLCDDRAHGSSG